MKKTTVLLKGPVLTQSGYGRHARQILMALLLDKGLEVFCENINWGTCSFLTEDTPEKKAIDSLVVKTQIIKEKGFKNFDIFIHVTIPQEFERLGAFNVGVTAAVETDRVSHQWIQKCNEMDLIVVPSEHSKKVIEKTVVEWQDPKTGNQGQFRLHKPIEVVPEGVDTSIFYPKSWSKEVLNVDFQTNFNFLHVGQWGRGGYGEDRKNIANLIKYFIETFYERKDVGLVLKVNMAKNSKVDRQVVEERIKQIKNNYDDSKIPDIYLIHGNLSDEELSHLYNHPKIKAFISLTAGEGYGLPLLEASVCDLPVIATNWSGHLDFLRDKFVPVNYELKEIPEPCVWEPVLIKGSRWAVVDEKHAKNRMRKIVEKYHKPKEKAVELGKENSEKLNLKVVSEKFVETLKKHIISSEAASSSLSPVEHLQSFIDDENAYNVLFTMPRSHGDVFVSTAVLDGLRKEIPEDAKVYFATDPKYFEILEDNPNVHKVIPWNQTMLSVDVTEEVFDLVLTPDIATQYQFSNWVRRGQGRNFVEEYANHCQCEVGNFFIKTEALSFDMPKKYITIHTGSGKGQWEARKYVEWQELLGNLKRLYTDIQVVQVGSEDEALLEGVIDLRGKTNVHQLAKVLQDSLLHVCIDTFSMHLAASFNTPIVALFGSSHAKSTGPYTKNKKDSKFILLEAEQKMGCNKACYKNSCKVNQALPCINEIDPAEVLESCAAILDKKFNGHFERKENFKYERLYGKISGYTTSYNAIKMGYPFVESIKSMLGFCNEVVVVDGESTDGTWEVLEKLKEEYPEQLEIYQNEWDTEEPAMDGMQKAFARALCENEFLWQQDLDEVVHESDYEKIKMITKRFPSNVDILHLPVIELWGDEKHVTGRRHAWKWRMSRNKPEITHGINEQARVTNEETGVVYAKENMSDGCEYIDVMSNKMIPHTGFWNDSLETARTALPSHYEKLMNQVFHQLPSVFHYSWCSLPLKINQFKENWDRQWNVLYQREQKERFPGVASEDEVQELSEKLKNQGGEDSDVVKYRFKLEKENPSIMKDWIEKNVK